MPRRRRGLDLIANLGVNGYTSADLIRDELPAAGPPPARVRVPPDRRERRRPGHVGGRLRGQPPGHLRGAPGPPPRQPDRHRGDPRLHRHAAGAAASAIRASRAGRSPPSTRSWSGSPRSAASATSTSSTCRGGRPRIARSWRPTACTRAAPSTGLWVERIAPVVADLLAGTSKPRARSAIAPLELLEAVRPRSRSGARSRGRPSRRPRPPAPPAVGWRAPAGPEDRDLAGRRRGIG